MKQLSSACLLLVAVLGLGCGISANAAEYFAAPDVTDDASKTCASEATAGTITNAMARATADDDVVTLLAGTYDMTRFTPKSGLFFDVAKKITVRSKAEDPKTVTLQGGGTSKSSRLFAFTDTSASVRGLTFTGFYSPSTDNGLIVGGTMSNCIFAANYSYGSVGTCINGSFCRDCSFTDNVHTNNNNHYNGGGAGSGGSYYNCRFERNRAYDSPGGHQGNGGALWKPSIASNCVFIGNYASRRGGAVGVAGSADYACRVVDSFFTNNTASVGGGAVWGVMVSDCVISGSAFRCSEGAAAHTVKAYDTVFADNICSNYSHYYGGGAAAYGSYYNCRFERNQLVRPGGHQSFGGAILQPTYVSNCVFVANSCDDRGGAIGRQGVDANYRSVIVDSHFTNNYAYAGGGAVCGASLTNCTFSGNASKSAGAAVQYVKAHDCRFVDNTCTNTSHYSGGGAGYSGWYYSCKFLRNQAITTSHNTRAGALLSPSVVSNCVFVGNYAVWHGGAVYGDATSLIRDSFFTNNAATYAGGAVYVGIVSNCVISGNVLTGGENGSGAYNVKAYDTLFVGNVLTNGNNGTSGGAQALGSAFNCTYCDNVDYSPVIRACASACLNVAMTNCLVVGNVCWNAGAANYGGSAVWAKSAPCVNCTIISNRCCATSLIGAAAGKFVNCIIADNTPCDVYNHSNSGTAVLSNCLYGTVGAGCTITTSECRQIDSVAKLKFKSCDVGSPDAFHIRRISPARNCGLDVGLTADDRDLSGHPRVFEDRIDIGAFECNDPKSGMVIIVR